MGEVPEVRSILFACLFLGVGAMPAEAITLSSKEWKVFSCVLKKAGDMGNPEVAANYAIDECPTQGLSTAQKERIIHLAIRRMMRESGLTCIGTGCGE